MTLTIHASIQAFLQGKSISELPGGRREGDDECLKAGVVPFVRRAGEPIKYYLMKPVPKHLELGAPPFQLCKGTRMRRNVGGWEDMREPTTLEKESLAATALREGNEELGLKMDEIGALFDLGSYDFSSSTSGEKKQMWLFAAEMKENARFLASDEIAASTAERGWLSMAEFTMVGRVDHRAILNDVESKLKAHYGA